MSTYLGQIMLYGLVVRVVGFKGEFLVFKPQPGYIVPLDKIISQAFHIRQGVKAVTGTSWGNKPATDWLHI